LPYQTEIPLRAADDRRKQPQSFAQAAAESFGTGSSSSRNHQGCGDRYKERCSEPRADKPQRAASDGSGTDKNVDDNATSSVKAGAAGPTKEKVVPAGNQQLSEETRLPARKRKAKGSGSNSCMAPALNLLLTETNAIVPVGLVNVRVNQLDGNGELVDVPSEELIKKQKRAVNNQNNSVGSMDKDNLKTELQQLMEAIKKSKEKISLLLYLKKKKEEEISLLLAQMAYNKKTQRILSFLRLVACAWALYSACFLSGLRAYYLLRPSTATDTSHQQCSEAETVAADEATAIAYGLLCCSVLQAAAAVMALLLTGRRRRALAYAALAATTVGQCMYGRIQWLLLVTYPGDDRIIPGVWLCVLALVDDLLLFVLLLVLERNAEDGGKQA
ncbi:hypothetical protein EJB05_24910, partial [Eragrostis curvula]